MALRPPSQYQMNALGTSGTGGAVQSLDHEILGEKAATLGRAGDRVEKALKRLAAEAPDSPQRPVLLKEAAEAVYAYFIQRELCGMRRHQDVIREYGIPAEVLVRLGAS
ncbi:MULTISPECIES: DUF6665 family protein [unclassified Aminobacter]|uniref:DUF6665 family protein n=1 Tax=unclassified Aminobacter TaxID=2644704 RepID=UPI00046557F1|nr:MULTISPECIES: DUF6665 family protein [unclassified Aminobacter]TWG61104.1 hypothetical protein L610_002400000530 [Aminobacter sp. J44]TWH31681.1 hypothetical protein L611_002400000160 [Aminobacter sp. J15]